MEDLTLKIQTKQRVSILAVILLFIIFVPSTFSMAFTQVSLYILIPLLFLFSVITNPRLILNYKPIIYLILLYFWSVITLTMSRDMSYSLREIRQITGVLLMCCVIIYFCFVNPKFIYVFYLLFIARFIYIFYHAYTNNLFNPYERFNIEQINANEFGYYGFFSIFSAFFLWQSARHKLLKTFLFVLFILCLVLSVLSCFYAASRAGMAFSLLTAAGLLLIYYFYPLSKRTVYGIIILIIAGMTLVPVLSYNYQGSILQRRFQIQDIESESRYSLIVKALEVGYQNPVLGVGPGNFRLYTVNNAFSHCSYTELFANNGIIALGLFIAILYYYFKKNKKLFYDEHSDQKNAIYFYCFIAIYALYNLFYVFYLNLFMLGFFFLVLAHLEITIKQGQADK